MTEKPGNTICSSSVEYERRYSVPKKDEKSQLPWEDLKQRVANTLKVEVRRSLSQLRATRK